MHPQSSDYKSGALLLSYLTKLCSGWELNPLTSTVFTERQSRLAPRCTVATGTDFGVAPIYCYPHISGLLPTAPNGKEVLIAMKPSHTLTYDKQCVAGRQSHASVMRRCVCLLRLPCSPPCSFLYILQYIKDT